MNKNKLKKYAPIIIICVIILGVSSFFIFSYSYTNPVMNELLPLEKKENTEKTLKDLLKPMDSLMLIIIIITVLGSVMFIFGFVMRL